MFLCYKFSNAFGCTEIEIHIRAFKLDLVHSIFSSLSKFGYAKLSKTLYLQFGQFSFLMLNSFVNVFRTNTGSTIKTLQVTLSNPCEQYPSLDMNEECKKLLSFHFDSFENGVF